MLRNRAAQLVYSTVFLATMLWLSIVEAGENTASQQIDIYIDNQQVIEPKTRRVVTRKNTLLTINWYSDEAGELHVHGYDINVQLQANTRVLSTFLARATGRFAVTSHGFGSEAGHSHGQRAMLYIEVHPD